MSDRRVVIETLATRIEYARELLGSLRSGAIEKSEIPTYAARTLESMLGSDFSEVYGDAAALSGDKGINPRAQQVIAGFINSSGTIVAFF